MPDEAMWQEIERAYVNSDESVAGIARRFGIDKSGVFKRARRYRWPRRHRNRERPHAPLAPGEDLESARDAVALQLYRRMSKRLRHMELGPATADASPAADDPDDRMLTQLIKQFEKLTGLDGISQRERSATATARQRGTAKPAAGPAAAPEQQHAPALDAERMRREIVERLERLHAERLARRNSE